MLDCGEEKVEFGRKHKWKECIKDSCLDPYDFLPLTMNPHDGDLRVSKSTC